MTHKKLIQPTLLAVGGHLKNTVAIYHDGKMKLSPEHGDLSSLQNINEFKRTIENILKKHGKTIEAVICDEHPDYISTQLAAGLGFPIIHVQHHFAHIASCMMEHDLNGRVLGIAFDGTGFGKDGTIWGGEFLLADDINFQRVGTFKRFQLPGGEKAIQEPRRSAIGMLTQIFDLEKKHYDALTPLQSFSDKERALIFQMLRKRINSPMTSSVGRIFDAVSSLIGLCQINEHEAQAAIELEHKIEPSDDAYPFTIDEVCEKWTNGSETLNIIDWTTMIQTILQDLENRTSLGQIAAKFHNTVVESSVTMAKKFNETRVCLSGGCFQNTYLTQRMTHRLREEGFKVYTHKTVSTTDSGIALGQLTIGKKQFNKENICV